MSKLINGNYTASILGVVEVKDDLLFYKTIRHDERKTMQIDYGQVPIYSMPNQGCNFLGHFKKL